MTVTYNNLRLVYKERFIPNYHPVVIFGEEMPTPVGREKPKPIDSKFGPIEVFAGRDRKLQKYVENWKAYYEKKGLIKSSKSSAESSFVPAVP